MAADEELTRWVVSESRNYALNATPMIRRAVTHSVLDWLGVAIAAADDPMAAMLSRSVLSDSDAPAGVLGQQKRGTASDAALWMGAVGHALDYDDTNMLIPGHPTAPVLPALLALAEIETLSGRDLLTGLILGADAQCRIGAVLSRSHYDTGFHPTATFGTIGAALACGYVLGFDEEMQRTAVGLAVAQTAGVRGSFGTMAKPVQVGHAAATGLRSALFVREGVTAPTSALEDSVGFIRTHHGANDGLAGAQSRLPADPVLQTLFKYHAACHLTQATLENCVEVLGRGWSPQAAQSFEVAVAPQARAVLRYDEPADGLEAKFSLPGVVALSLLGHDTADPLTFSDDVMRTPEIVDVISRTSAVAEPGHPLTWARLRIVGSDGRAEVAECDVGTPETDLDARETRLREKFSSLAKRAIGERADWLAGMALELDALPDASQLTSATRSDQRGTGAEAEQQALPVEG